MDFLIGAIVAAIIMGLLLIFFSSKVEASNERFNAKYMPGFSGFGGRKIFRILGVVLLTLGLVGLIIYVSI